MIKISVCRFSTCIIRTTNSQSTTYIKKDFLYHHSLFIQFLSKSFCSLSPEDILSQSNKENCLNLLNASSKKNIYKPDIKKAAVLVPLCIVNQKLSLLYIVRALKLKVNGGEVAFPGGMKDDTDISLEETALRETYEEIGISRSDINVWGRGGDIHRPGVVVTPVLGYIENFSFEKLNINYNEVSETFTVTLNDLTNVENFRTTQFRYENTHVYNTPVFIGVKKIWGLTAVITHTILSALIPNVYNRNINYKPMYHKILLNESQ